MLILFLIYSSLQNMLEYAFLMGRVKFETKFGNGRKYYKCKICLNKLDLSHRFTKFPVIKWNWTEISYFLCPRKKPLYCSTNDFMETAFGCQFTGMRLWNWIFMKKIYIDYHQLDNKLNKNAKPIRRFDWKARKYVSVFLARNVYKVSVSNLYGKAVNLVGISPQIVLFIFSLELMKH